MCVCIYIYIYIYIFVCVCVSAIADTNVFKYFKQIHEIISIYVSFN